MAEITYEITEELGVLSENSRGWTKELNMVSWNNAEPKFDIREWDPDRKRMSKGITLTWDEAEILNELLTEALSKDIPF
ncbi:MAG: hypothetical protein J5822_08645 [Eubacteriaceae bacterium]|nr:hypothetical protein [Eubacteriaceae bacterium]